MKMQKVSLLGKKSENILKIIELFKFVRFSKRLVVIEDRRLKSEVMRLKSEDRSQESEVRRQ
jgi:hypothetical protein